MSDGGRTWNSLMRDRELREYRTIRRLGCVRISTDLLAAYLDLPEDTKIIDVRRELGITGTININVESPNLPELIEGQALPWVDIRTLRGWDE